MKPYALLPLLLLSSATACERTNYYASSGAGAGGPAGSGPGSGSGNDPIGNTPAGATRTELLAAVASCSASLFDEFRVAAADLEAKTATASSSGTPESIEAAQASWRQAAAVWQQAELFQFGPVGPASSPGGQELRAYIYSWPLVSRCLTEQTIVNQKYAAADFPVVGLINVRGLSAGEYLQFYTGTDNACGPDSSINANGTWNALGSGELAARKRAYAAVVARDISVRAADLHGIYAGSFASQMSAPGGEGSPYESEQHALNAISDALFYLDKAVKDQKLAVPVGLIDCEAEVCPGALESVYARASKAHIQNNLLGFRRIMLGCDAGREQAEEGVGFDDLLVAVGAEPIASALRQDIESSLAAVAAIEEDDLAAALAEDKQSVVALHKAIKGITDTLKTDFVSVLDLELPKTVEGDND
jgi:uncharacterized protein